MRPEYANAFGLRKVSDKEGELLEVTDKKQLDTAERQRSVAITAQHIVNGIKHIGAHHAYLINHKEIHTADHAYLLLVEAMMHLFVTLHAGNKRSEIKLKERVQRHAAGIDGGNARRSRHNNSLACRITEIAKKSGFARSGLAGKEKTRTGVLHDPARDIKTLVCFHIAYYFYCTSPGS